MTLITYQREVQKESSIGLVTAANIDSLELALFRRKYAQSELIEIGIRLIKNMVTTAIKSTSIAISELRDAVIGNKINATRLSFLAVFSIGSFYLE
jgi:hypothetical protein